ncbi:MAG: lipopolysaccharide biosynthesis protein [Thiothrix sp.]|nr:lipopolysaccharide biosynthesis protein [Thiothrix sp.]HPE60388.1 lipopolysaccharide biosynthesis protein [Thiolinea sp.]
MIWKHSLVYLLARLVPGLLNFAALALYTRLLTPEQYGTYALVMAVTSFLQLLLFGWINQSLLRYLPRFADREAAFLSTVMAVYGGVGAVALLVALVAALLALVYPAALLVSLAALLLLTWAAFELGLQLQNSRFQPGSYSFMSVLKALTALAAGVGLVWLGFGAAGILGGLILGNFLPLWLFNRRQLRQFDRRLVEYEMLGHLWRYGLPLSASVLMSEVIYSSDRLLLAWLQGKAAAGQYAVACDLPAFTLNMLMMGINLAAYPALVQALEQGDRQQLRGCRLQHFRLLFAVALPASAGLILVAPNLVTLMIGVEFQPAVRALLPVIAVAVLFSGLKAYYFDLAFQLGEHPRGQLQILMLAAGLNLILNLVLIPLWSMQGAALATLITFMAALLLSAVRGRHHFPLVFPLADLGKMILAVGVMVAVLLPLYDIRGAGWLLLQVLGGTVVYGLVLLLLSGRTWGARISGIDLPFISR